MGPQRVVHLVGIAASDFILDGLNGLIIPGGESTTIGKLATDFGLMKPPYAFYEGVKVPEKKS